MRITMKAIKSKIKILMNKNYFRYGMYHGRPCVILKMNNIYGWEPRPYYNLTQVIIMFYLSKIIIPPILYSYSFHPKIMA